MKKRNGFTLVELLGVIVVLAILALITIPIISNVVNNVRIKSLQNSAYGLIEASNLYYISKGNNITIRFDKNKDKNTLKELSYKGVVKEGTVILDKKGKVTVCITDGRNSAYKNYIETRVTTSKGKICSIGENSSIVYLDDEATINEYDGVTLTELVNSMQEEINTLKSNDSSINQQITNLSTRLSEINSAMISLNDVYPVGSIYITVEEDTVAKVQAKFGGTWVAFSSGRTLVGVDTSQTEFNTVEKTGGEKTHTLTVDEMPSHNHTGETVYQNGMNATYTSQYGFTIKDCTNGCWPTMYRQGIGSTGGSQPHNNLQPYITVYMYKRVS